MGYDHFRYARRIDADTIGIYHNDMSKLLDLSKAVANEITLAASGVSGADFNLRANLTDAYPRIDLEGNTYLKLMAKTDTLFYKAATQIAKLLNATNVTTLTGGAVTGDDLVLKANSVDDYPKIELKGNGQIHFNPPSGQDAMFSMGGAGRVRFGTHTATGDTVSNGSIEIKDAGGTLRKLMTKA